MPGLKVFITGPMSGLPDFNYPAFFEAAERLQKEGYDPVNPADIGVRIGWSWEDYLRESISMLMQAKGFTTLPGWERSRGARLEVDVARELGMFEIVL